MARDTGGHEIDVVFVMRLRASSNELRLLSPLKSSTTRLRSHVFRAQGFRPWQSMSVSFLAKLELQGERWIKRLQEEQSVV